MRQQLKSLLTYALAHHKAFPTAMTAREALESLIDRLAPISTNKGLIRMGPSGDGGYLVPDDLNGIAACFSPGVSLISGFEKDCAERGIKVFMADRSVDSPAESHALFSFTKKYIGVTSNPDFMTIDDWVDTSLQDTGADLLLQIDIEGYEYETFLAASDQLMGRFRIIVAEFHHLDQLWSAPFFKLASRAFDKILQTHTCVHIHPNNCCGQLQKDGLSIPRLAEFTFLRNDRVTGSSAAQQFPHPLDFDNTSNPHMPLPACWYRKKN